jgi:hypothetical protein
MLNFSMRSCGVFLVPAIAALSFGLDTTKAFAQTTYPFNGNYSTTVKITPIAGNVSQVFEVGISDDAPYDLEYYEGLTYSVLDDKGNLTFNNNPEVFGIQGYSNGYIQFGSGTNKLFGTSDAGASVNFENLTAKGSGVVYITSGEGIFKNATSTLLFSEDDIVNLGDIITLYGVANVNGSTEVSQKVPEPTATTALVSVGLIGVGLFLKRQRKQIPTQLHAK